MLHEVDNTLKNHPLLHHIAYTFHDPYEVRHASNKTEQLAKKTDLLTRGPK